MFFDLWKEGLDSDLRREMREEHPTAELWVTVLSDLAFIHRIPLFVYPFKILGHSFGGSLAALASSWVAKSELVPPERIRFISFGQPRTGNLDFGRHFDQLVLTNHTLMAISLTHRS